MIQSNYSSVPDEFRLLFRPGIPRLFRSTSRVTFLLFRQDYSRMKIRRLIQIFLPS